jgi:hypothetical protein
MRLRTIFVVAAAVATLCGSALAASAAQSPLTLVLGKSEFPAGARYHSGLMPGSFSQGLRALGVSAQGAYVSVQIATGTAKYRGVDSFVVTTGSAGQARTAFKAFKQELAIGDTSPLRLPSYGDEQLALLQAPKLGLGASLLVRKNRVVWQLELGGGGLQVMSRATLLAELQKYARKQKTRVGAG